MPTTIKVVAAAIFAATAVPASAATLVISGGVLTGATGVNVGGSLYDVSFLDGTCASVFGTCVASSFDFATDVSADVAAQALLDQVFTGIYDTNAALTSGCESTSINACYAFIPTAATASSFSGVGALNALESIDSPFTFVAGSTSDFGTISEFTFAKFALSRVTDSVPEPSSWAMMLTGFAGIGYSMRRRRKPLASARAA